MNVHRGRALFLVTLLVVAAAATVTIGSRGLPAEVEIASKRIGEASWGTAYLISFRDGGRLHEDHAVSRDAWDALRVGDDLPARRSITGELMTVEMRYAR